MRKPSPAKLADVVRRHLSDDLRRAPYKGNPNPMAGHCYVASEALYHMLGGKQSPWVPQYVHHEGSPHWFLKHRGTGEVLDATSEQFKTPVPYHASVGKGFLTRDPSARARTVIQAAQAALPGQLTKAERDQKQVASIAAFNKDGMLLFGRRNDNGKWTLPGGHFEPGEDKNKAAVRELYEETGLTPVGMRYLGAKQGGRNGEVMVHAFAASVKGDVSFQNDPDQEFAEAKWVNPQAIPSEIMDNLHNPKNVTLQLLGIQEDLVKAEGDMPKPPEPPQFEQPSEETMQFIANADLGNPTHRDRLGDMIGHENPNLARPAMDKVVNSFAQAPNTFMSSGHNRLLDGIIESPRATDDHLLAIHNGLQGTAFANDVIQYADRVPLSLQQQIAKDGDSRQVSLLLGLHKNVHPDVLKEFIRTGNGVNTPEHLAQHPALDEEGVRLAFQNPLLRNYVLRRKDAPNDLRKEGIAQGHAKSVFHDSVRKLSPDVIDLAIDHSDDSRKALATWAGDHKMDDAQTLRFLLKGDGDTLRRFGDYNRDHLREFFKKPENVESFLTQMKDDHYRPIAGPAQLRSRLEGDPELAHKLLWGASSNHPNREHVAELLSGTDSKFLLDKILNDHDPEVADTVLHSHHLTPEQLEPFVNKPEHFPHLSRNPSLTKEQFDRTVDGLFNADDKKSKAIREVLPAILGNSGALYRLRDFNQALTEIAPELRDNYSKDWYRRNPDMVLAHRIGPEHLDKLIQPSMGDRELNQLLNHPNLSDKTLARVVESPEFKLHENNGGPFSAAIYHPNVSEQTLEKILALPQYDDYHKGKVRETLGEKNPDYLFDKKVAVKLGTSKLRQVRDAILDSKRPFAHKKEFADKGVDLTPFTIPGTANVSAEKIQQHIDSLQPHATYNVSEDVWNGGQRHSDENSKVFQLNLTTDLINKMKQEGVYDTFKQMHEASRSSGHPVHQKHGLGWVRYTQGSAPQDGARDDFYEPEAMAERLANGDYDAQRPNQTPETGKGQPDKDHFFIDEIQSDFGQDFARNILTNTVNQHRRDGEEQGLEGEELEDYVREREAETAREVGARYPQEHVEKINNILFGGKYANEILAEAFLQHLRDKGHAGSQIRIHHANTKAPLAQLRVRDDGSPHKKWIDTKNGNRTEWREAEEGEPDEAQKQAFLAAGIKPVDDIPRVHMETYGTMPKKVLGMRPTTYGELATESNPDLKGKATWGKKLAKKEDFSEHYNWEDEPALHQPEDEVDRMLQHPSAIERQIALKHPGVTEDHLIRYLMGPHVPNVEALLRHPEAKERFQNFAYGHYSSPDNSSDNGLRSIAQYANSKPLLDWMAQHGDPKYLSRLLLNKNVTDEHLLTALRRPDLQKQDFVGLGPTHVANMSPEVMNEYIKYSLAHPRGSVDSVVAQSPMLNDEALATLASNSKSAVAVAANPKLKLEHALKALPYASNLFVDNLAHAHPEYLKHPEIARHLLSANTAKVAIDNGVGTPEQLLEIARHTPDEYTAKAILSRPESTIHHYRAVKENVHLPLHGRDWASDFLDNPNRSAEDVTEVFPHLNYWGSLIPAFETHGHKLSPEQQARILDGLKEGKKDFAQRANLSKEAQIKLLDDAYRNYESHDPDGSQYIRENAVRGLLKNPNLHPEAIDTLLDKYSKLNPSMVGTVLQHPNFSEGHHRKLVANGHTDDPAMMLSHIMRAPTLDLVQAALDRAPTVKNYDAAFDNKNVKLPDDTMFRAIDVASADPDDYAGQILIKDLVSQRPHLHDRLAEHSNYVVRQAVAKKTDNPELLTKLAADSDSEVRETALSNGSTPPEALEAALRSRRLFPSLRANIKERLAALKPDAFHKEVVHAKFGTNKARKLRDLILASGNLEMRHKDLGNLAQGVKYGVNPKNGNLSAELLQQYIDSQPTARYNVSHDKWNGIQRHNDENSKVFQLNLTDEHVRQMQQAGVYGTFLKLQDQFKASHPLRDHSIGWVRYTGKTRGKGKGIFIDEVQSDHTVPLAEKAKTQAHQRKMQNSHQNFQRHNYTLPSELDTFDETEKGHGYLWNLYGRQNAPIPEHLSAESKEFLGRLKDNYSLAHKDATEAAQNAFENVNADYPAEHQKKINEILFGGKHSSEVLMEAFHQHLRDKGHIGVPVAIHSVHSKAAENLSDLEPGPDGKVDLSKVPGHYQKGYKQVPEAMQMEPATYAADNMATQDNPEHQGKPTYQQPLRKKTE
jgi:8-oxo-dGTP pyrophosphatase MutT (NUDIX family)